MPGIETIQAIKKFQSITTPVAEDKNDDFEVRSLDTICINESQKQHPWWYNFKYMGVGLLVGIDRKSVV